MTAAPAPAQGAHAPAELASNWSDLARKPRRRHELEFLPAALEILETPASPAGRAIAATICLFLVLALAWSVVGRVDIVATAPGTVIPAGKSKEVQPLDASVVRSILVQDGDHVRAGQVVVTLDVVAAAAERDRLARDLWQARLDVAGLQALRGDLATGIGIASFTPPADAPADAVATERASIIARRAEQLAKLAGLEQQIASKQAEVAENRAMVAKLQAALPLLKQKRDLYRSLLNVQFTNKAAWLDAEQAYSDQAHQLVVQQQHDATLAADIAALVQQADEAKATYDRDLMKDLSDAEQKTGDLAQQFTAASHKADQDVLRAPIDGTVQQLAIHTVGGVVTPAERLMTIVPDAAPVLIEATVDNKDIGFVHVGQAVEVKVETFTFTRYGLLHGHVLDVSRDNVSDNGMPRRTNDTQTRNVAGDDADGSDTKMPGYVAHIALDRTRLLVNGHDVAITPGMAVTAEIKTGRRSVISYLLSPLRKYANEGMHER